jgi:hypothetical protein
LNPLRIRIRTFVIVSRQTYGNSNGNGNAIVSRQTYGNGNGGSNPRFELSSNCVNIVRLDRSATTACFLVKILPNKVVSKFFQKTSTFCSSINLISSQDLYKIVIHLVKQFFDMCSINRFLGNKNYVNIGAVAGQSWPMHLPFTLEIWIQILALTENIILFCLCQI